MGIESKGDPKGYVSTKKADMIPDQFTVNKVVGKAGWVMGTLNGEAGWAKISIGGKIFGMGKIPNRGKAPPRVIPNTKSAKAGAE